MLGRILVGETPMVVLSFGMSEIILKQGFTHSECTG